MMKSPLTVSSLLLTATLSHAALSWTGGGDAISLYQEANWLEDDGSPLEANEINGNTVVTADTGGLIEIAGGAGAPSNYGGSFLLPAGVDLTIANGKTLGSGGGSALTGGGAGSVLSVSSGATLGVGSVTEFENIFVDNATIDLVGVAGIATVSGPSIFAISNGGVVVTQFVSLGVSITVDGTSSIEFLGGGDPINSQAGGPATVDLATGGQLTMVNAAEIDEAIGQNEIFVNGTQVTLANRDTLLSIAGGTATAIPEPTASLLGALALLALGRRRRG